MNIKGKDFLPAELQSDDSRRVDVPRLRFYSSANGGEWVFDFSDVLSITRPDGSATVLELASGDGINYLGGQWSLGDQDYTSGNQVGDGGVVNVGYLKSFVQDTLAAIPEGKTIIDLYVDGVDLVLKFSDDTSLTTSLQFLELDYTDLIHEEPNATNLWFTQARVLATPLTGYTQASTNRNLIATDTVNGALGVLEKRLVDTEAIVAALPNPVLPPATQHTFRAASDADMYYVAVPVLDSEGSHNPLKLLSKTLNIKGIKIEFMSTSQDAPYAHITSFEQADQYLTGALAGGDDLPDIVVLRFSVTRSDTLPGYVCFSI